MTIRTLIYWNYILALSFLKIIYFKGVFFRFTVSILIFKFLCTQAHDISAIVQTDWILAIRDHRQNAVLNSILVNLIMLLKIIKTEFEATQLNLEAAGLTQQNMKQKNLGQRNGIWSKNNRIWETQQNLR